MSLLQTTRTNKQGVTVKTFINNELAQLILALLLVVVYLIEVIKGLGSDQFLAGALVTVIGYYFGGKASTTAATTTANALNSNTSNPANTTTQA